MRCWGSHSHNMCSEFFSVHLKQNAMNDEWQLIDRSIQWVENTFSSVRRRNENCKNCCKWVNQHTGRYKEHGIRSSNIGSKHVKESHVFACLNLARFVWIHVESSVAVCTGVLCMSLTLCVCVCYCLLLLLMMIVYQVLLRAIVDKIQFCQVFENDFFSLLFFLLRL